MAFQVINEPRPKARASAIVSRDEFSPGTAAIRGGNSVLKRCTLTRGYPHRQKRRKQGLTRAGELLYTEGTK